MAVSNEFDWHYGGAIPDFKDVPILYRYEPIEEPYLTTLAQRSLWVSDPKKFNDPYDCWAHIDQSEVSPKQFAEFLYAYSHSKGDSRTVKEIVDSIAKYSKEPGSDAFSRALKALSSRLVTYMGAVVFSSQSESVLMWSHYANAHKGVCFGYQRQGMQILRDIPAGPTPVQYGKSIVSMLNVFSEDFNLLSDVAIQKFFYTKTPDWKYEKEWRLLTLYGLAGARVKLDDCRTKLVEVIFGTKVTPEDEAKVLNTLRVIGLDVNCYRLKYNAKSERLERLPVFSCLS